MFALDHIVIAAETLDEGTQFTEDLLGVPLAPGGQHHFMGTHNRLLSLGPKTYLEVIAIDPSLPHPAKARWFGLDAFSGSPRLVAWVWSSDPIENYAQLPGHYPVPETRTRGDLRWDMTTPIDSPLGLLAPSVLYWHGETPQGRLPDAGVSLLEVSVAHPEAALLPDLPDKRVIIAPGDPKMSARFDTPKGEVSL